MSARQPAGVLFDLDGTLLDTARDLAAALNTVRGADGLPPLPFETIRPHVSNGSYALTELGFDHARDSVAFETRRQALLDAYHADVASHTVMFDGMKDVLERIVAGSRRWGIVTNKPTWLTTPLLQALALEPAPGCVVCGDTTARAKPHPDPLFEAARLLDLPPAHCLYVGDAERDVESARAAGMRVVVALYGYIPADSDAAAWPADGWVRSPRELIGWL